MPEDEEDFQTIKNYSFRLLSVRPRSEAEFTLKLKAYTEKKHFPENLIIRTVEFFKELNYLNDVDFANWWVDQRNRTSVRGNQIIKYELLAKGISRDIIDNVLAHQEKGIELEKAKNLLKKHLGKIPKETDIRLVKSKAYAFLFRKGFKSDVINRAIDEYFKNDRID